MTEIRGYHAHVYYNADTRKIAEGLRDTIANRFGVEPRALSDEPRGPHPIPQRGYPPARTADAQGDAAHRQRGLDLAGPLKIGPASWSGYPPCEHDRPTEPERAEWWK